MQTGGSGWGSWGEGVGPAISVSPRRVVMPVLCPHRSPWPHATPRHAWPPSADASSWLQRAPSPPALRLPESPAAPPSCPAAPRSPAARPLEGAFALSVGLTTPPLSPQTLLPRWASRRGRGVQSRPSSPLALPVSLFFFLVVILVTLPPPPSLHLCLKDFPKVLFTRFSFFYVKQRLLV